ncbi:MAG TPA: signal peptidase I, partial [Magnetospirillaceae bacterium]|nr:signal peptidase I [Magnetospirillaceae bacterium]
MNPNQAPGNAAPGGQPMPPQQPASMNDIPDDGFGFADERLNPAAVQPIVSEPVVVSVPVAPAQPVSPRPHPTLSVTPRSVPVPPPPAPIVPTPQPVLQAMPSQPIPLTSSPITPTRPTNIMPPQQVPAVPILAVSPSTLPPTAPPQSAPRAPVVAKPIVPPTPAGIPTAPSPTSVVPPQALVSPIKLGSSFDPSSVPVHASSTSENPITASFTPAQSTHVPDDIAKRIAEHPIQNSDEVLRLAKHGFDLRRIKGIASFLFFTAGIFIAAFLINQFIFQSYYVEGTSMTPTLQNNDRLIISKVERSLAVVQGQPYIPQRGQIVVLDSSIVGINGQKEQLIKRVIGLPGDHIHIESGAV